MTLLGSNLAPTGASAPEGTAEPLLGGVRVYRKDGTSLPLLRVAPGRIDLPLPAHANEVETLTVRHSGMDSANVTIRTARAAPVIEGVKPLGQGAYEIYASGLGEGAPQLRVLYSGGSADLLESSPVAGRPGLLQISVMIEPGAQGSFRVEASGTLSPPFPY